MKPADARCHQHRRERAAHRSFHSGSFAMRSATWNTAYLAPGVGGIGQLLDLAERRREAALLQDRLREFRHHRLGTQRRRIDALDLEQERGGALDQLHRFGSERVRQDDARRRAAAFLGIRAVGGHPQRALRKAGGLLPRHLDDFHRVLRIGEEQLRIELGVEPRLDDVGPLLDQVGAHAQEAGVVLVDRSAGRDLARQPFQHQARGRRLPHHRRVELAGAEVAGDHLDVLVQIRRRLDPRAS